MRFIIPDSHFFRDHLHTLLADGVLVRQVPITKLLLPFFLVALLVVCIVVGFLFVLISRPSAWLGDHVVYLLPCFISSILCGPFIDDEPTSLLLLVLQESQPSQCARSLLRPFKNTGSQHALLIDSSHNFINYNFIRASFF